MRSKGLSLSLNMIVIALVVSLVAITVIVAFSSNFSTIESFIGGGIDDSTLDLAGENCISDYQRLCNMPGYPDGATNWSEDSTFNGQTCRHWIEQGALGGNVRGCGGAGY
jgi:hypothetical protein